MFCSFIIHFQECSISKQTAKVLFLKRLKTKLRLKSFVTNIQNVFESLWGGQFEQYQFVLKFVPFLPIPRTKDFSSKSFESLKIFYFEPKTISTKLLESLTAKFLKKCVWKIFVRYSEGRRWFFGKHLTSVRSHNKCFINRVGLFHTRKYRTRSFHMAVVSPGCTGKL